MNLPSGDEQAKAVQELAKPGTKALEGTGGFLCVPEGIQAGSSLGV
jgi:hypothetical protein